MDANSYGPHQTKVPCKFCGDLTIHTGTERCDNCWEVAHRVRDMPVAVLVKILQEECGLEVLSRVLTNRPDSGRQVRGGWGGSGAVSRLGVGAESGAVFALCTIEGCPV